MIDDIWYIFNSDALSHFYARIHTHIRVSLGNWKIEQNQIEFVADDCPDASMMLIKIIQMEIFEYISNKLQRVLIFIHSLISFSWSGKWVNEIVCWSRDFGSITEEINGEWNQVHTWFCCVLFHYFVRWRIEFSVCVYVANERALGWFVHCIEHISLTRRKIVKLPIKPKVWTVSSSDSERSLCNFIQFSLAT